MLRFLRFMAKYILIYGREWQWIHQGVIARLIAVRRLPPLMARLWVNVLLSRFRSSGLR